MSLKLKLEEMTFIHRTFPVNPVLPVSSQQSDQTELYKVASPGL